MLDRNKNQGQPAKYLRNVNVRWFEFDLADLQSLLISPEERQALSVEDGDLFVCEGGEPGRCAVWRGKSDGLTYQKALHRIRVHTGIEPEFLMYQLRHEAESGRLARAFTGSTIKHLTGESLARYPLVVAPSRGQKRIANQLESLLSKVKRCREQLERVSQLLKRLQEAVLEAAVSGRLTEEWRSSRYPSNKYLPFDSEESPFQGYTVPDHWDKCRLVDIADITGGITKDSKKQDPLFEQLPYLRVANVQRGSLDLSEMKTIQVPPDRVKDLRLLEGDVLFTEGGDLDKLGRGWVWEGQIERCVFQNHIFRARLKDQRYVPKFFSFFGNSRAYRYFLAYGKQTTNLASINKSVLSALPIPVPSTDEQQEIVRRVDELFSLTDSLQRQYQTAIARLEKLTPALLAKAFRGQLVPENPQNEPAEEILQRIRDSRATHSSLPKRPQRNNRHVMPTLTASAVKEAIQRLPAERFTFADLRAHLGGGDYEILKSIVFQLLSERDPSIKQVFDKNLSTMQLVRT